MTINPFLTVEHTTAAAIRIAEHSGRRTMVVRDDADARPLRVVFADALASPDCTIVLIAEPAPANDGPADLATVLCGFRS